MLEWWDRSGWVSGGKGEMGEGEWDIDNGEGWYHLKCKCIKWLIKYRCAKNNYSNQYSAIWLVTCAQAPCILVNIFLGKSPLLGSIPEFFLLPRYLTIYSTLSLSERFFNWQVIHSIQCIRHSLYMGGLLGTRYNTFKVIYPVTSFVQPINLLKVVSIND